jgi:hypothetical protein
MSANHPERSSDRAVGVVAGPAFLLQFLIVALDPPAQFGQINEIPQRRRQSGQPILRGFGFPFWPL